jgi:hypothetical protein
MLRYYLCFWRGKSNIGCHLFKVVSLHESHNNDIGNHFYINSHYIHFHLFHMFKFFCGFWSLEFLYKCKIIANALHIYDFD